MTDHEDSLLHGEFTAYRSALMEDVQPVGPTAVRATVRRRRRTAGAAVAALALTLVAGPAVGYAALHRDHAAPRRPAGSGQPTGLPTTAPTPTPSATAISTAGAASDRIDRSELLAARLDLPAWGPGGSCPTEGVRLVDGEGDAGDVVLEKSTLRDLRYTDVDRDGTTETIAVLQCLGGEVEPNAQQVVAFDRDPTGRIVTRGQVAHNDAGLWFRSLDSRPDGSVRIEVWKNPPSDGSAPDPANRQWRTNRWRGDRFVQTGGPTAFPKPKPANLTITATDLVYGSPDENGTRRGAMTVTITNTGGSTADHPMVTFPRSGNDSPDHTLWNACNPLIAKPDAFRCLVDPLAPGKQKTYTFQFFTTVNAPPATATVRVDLADADGSALPSGGDQTTYLITRNA